MKTKNIVMITALMVFTFSMAQTVSRVTVGVGMGGNHLFDNLYEYSLSTDGNYNLGIDEKSRNNLVLSPVIAFRLEKFDVAAGNTMVETAGGGNVGPLDLCRFNILISANMLDLKSDSIGFNKYIDGGFGIGYAFSPDIQLGIFYEVQRFRQLKDYIADTYEGQPIPKSATEFYNALDETDNNIFHDKVLHGISLKLIFNVKSL